jgi:hypothetical protein
MDVSIDQTFDNLLSSMILYRYQPKEERGSPNKQNPEEAASPTNGHQE